jgi:soluble lytic murein transglycosylase-like protein
MPSENNLTVRDYFDRVIGAKPRSKRTMTSGRIRSSGTSGFHQVLKSRQQQDSSIPRAKSNGLKISDYLARPVHVKNKIRPRPAITPVQKSTTGAAAFSGHPALAEPRVAIKKSAVSSQPEKKDVLRLHAAGLIPGQQQADAGERQKIETSILKAAQKYDLPTNLIKSVIRAESNFQVKAVSHAGAQGLMQLMPATARELGVKNPFSIEENVDGGSRYLRKMLDSFGGNLKLALAAYNAGPEAVIKYGGKVPPYRETQQYVKRVLRFTRQLA